MSTLILFLPPARPGPATEYSYTLTADGHTALRHATAPAALLPEPTRPGGEVVAVVPARALSWQRVQLPPGLALGAGQQTPRLRSVLEGLLEDRLLDDASQLHFAIQPDANPGEPVWVAVCDRTWLRDNLQALEAASRRAWRLGSGPVRSGQHRPHPGAAQGGQPGQRTAERPTVARSALGRSTAGGGASGGAQCLGLAGAQGAGRQTGGRAVHADPDFPQGAGGGGCPGADGARTCPAAAGGRRRFGPRPGAPACRRRSPPPQRPPAHGHRIRPRRAAPARRHAGPR